MEINSFYHNSFSYQLIYVVYKKDNTRLLNKSRKFSILADRCLYKNYRWSYENWHVLNSGGDDFHGQPTFEELHGSPPEWDYNCNFSFHFISSIFTHESLSSILHNDVNQNT